MIKISNVLTLEGKRIDLQYPGDSEVFIDGSHLTAFPGLIDPHVHFRVPGKEEKEDWTTASAAALAGGYTTVFDMPNNHPACISAPRFQRKCDLIDEQLKKAGIPLRYHLYLGADKYHLDEISTLKDEIIGVKIFMGSSEGDLMMDDEASLHAVFSHAAALGLIVSVHAEDEALIKERKAKCTIKEAHAHSWIRNHEVALRATEKALELCAIYGTRLNILHVSTHEELLLIKKAKKKGLKVTAETCPHYLFLTDEDYVRLGTKVQVNPSLKMAEDRDALWQAICDGTIDMIGSDHAPHLLEEKERPYGQAPSGLPGIETTLPLLLTAHHQGRLSLEQIAHLTCLNSRSIFGLSPNTDTTLVDLNKERIVHRDHLKTKCRWSPYEGMLLKGWPIYTIIKGNVYHAQKSLFAKI